MKKLTTLIAIIASFSTQAQLAFPVDTTTGLMPKMIIARWQEDTTINIYYQQVFEMTVVCDGVSEEFKIVGNIETVTKVGENYVPVLDNNGRAISNPLEMGGPVAQNPSFVILFTNPQVLNAICNAYYQYGVFTGKVKPGSTLAQP